MVKGFYMLSFGDKHKAWRLLICTNPVLKVEIVSCFQVGFICC